MASSINSNGSAQFAQRGIYTAQNHAHTSMQRLSSGLRINSARDDATGLGIATRMTSHISSSLPLMRGMNDGISLLQVAGGGLRGVLDILQRAREISIQAANGTLADSDRMALNDEYQQMMSQIDQLANSTQAFGKFPLKGAVKPSTVKSIADVFANGVTKAGVPSGIKPVAYIPAGAVNVTINIDDYGADDDIQVFTQGGKHLAGTPLTDAVWNGNAVSVPSDVNATVLTTANGFLGSASYDASLLLDGHTGFTEPPATGLQKDYNGMHISYSGDGHDRFPSSLNEQVTIDKTTEPLVVMVVGSGSFGVTASWDSMPTDTPQGDQGPVKILVNDTPGAADSFVTIEQTPSDTNSLGLVGAALHPQDKVMAAIAALDAAINQVGSYSATHGATESRLDAALGNAALSLATTSAARGRIMDADYAMESAALAVSLMKSSASMAMSAQANVGPKFLLKLLRE